MAKELEKFQSDYKKIKPLLDKYNTTKAEGVWQRAKLAMANCEEGETNIKETLVVARKEGVAGTTLADFNKSKSFAEAKKYYDMAVNAWATEYKDFVTFCDEAEEAAKKFGTLNVAINKDLKGRKDKSESKKEIEGLRDQTYSDYQGLMKVVTDFRKKPNKYQQNYVDNYVKNLNQIISIAPEESKQRKEDTELPQMLVDRNLKANVGKAAGLMKKIDEGCNDAIEAAGEDVKKAVPLLKAAGEDLVKLKKINSDYETIAEKYKDDLAVSKDKGKIETAMKQIAKAYEVSERKLRGTATTIKKAG